MLAFAAFFLAAAGCSRHEEPPETAAYRRVAARLQTENQQLRQEVNAASQEVNQASQVLSITSTALVVVGCGLAASLFVIRWTSRRRRR